MSLRPLCLILVASGAFIYGNAFASLSVSITGVSSAGGIVYLHSVAQMTGCFRLTTNYATVSGSIISVTFDGRKSDFCTLQIPPQTTWKTNTTVLGPLPTGTYTLRVYMPQPDDFGSDVFGPELRYIINPCSITNSSPSRTFSINSPAMDSNFSLSVDGVAGARYIIDMSTNLVDWTPVFTNTGGPFNFISPYDRARTNCIYRTRILSSE